MSTLTPRIRAQILALRKQVGTPEPSAATKARAALILYWEWRLGQESLPADQSCLDRAIATVAYGASHGLGNNPTKRSFWHGLPPVDVSGLLISQHLAA